MRWSIKPRCEPQIERNYKQVSNTSPIIYLSNTFGESAGPITSSPSKGGASDVFFCLRGYKDGLQPETLADGKGGVSVVFFWQMGNPRCVKTKYQHLAGQLIFMRIEARRKQALSL
jgi:hypothetical protein